MKKIISTLALATLAFGASFADVKFTCNYRTQAVAFSRVMKADSYSATANGEKFQAYMLSNTAYGGDSDTFSMEASNDFGGVKVRIDPKGSAGNEATDKDKYLTLNEYSGYITIGGLTLTAGYWKDGKMNGAYQLKNDMDASNLGGDTFAAYKLGSMFKKSITLQVDDITSFGGSAHATGYLTYAADLGPVLLKADLAAISLDGTNTWDGSNYFSGLGARIDAKLENWDIQFVIKQANITKGKSQRALALHVQPLSWGSLKATFGGSLGFYEGELTEYNADIRFRYASGPLSITFMNNLSRITDIGATKMSVDDYNKHVGAYFLNKDGEMKNQTNKNKASRSAMWNMLAIRFKVSDKLFLTGEVGDIVGFKSAGKVFGDYGVEAFVAPGFQVFAGKNCSVSTCFRIGMSNLFMDSDTYKDIEPAMSFLVPVVMRVKL